MSREKFIQKLKSEIDYDRYYGLSTGFEIIQSQPITQYEEITYPYFIFWKRKDFFKIDRVQYLYFKSIRFNGFKADIGVTDSHISATFHINIFFNGVCLGQKSFNINREDSIETTNNTWSGVWGYIDEITKKLDDNENRNKLND